MKLETELRETTTNAKLLVVVIMGLRSTWNVLSYPIGWLSWAQTRIQASTSSSEF